MGARGGAGTAAWAVALVCALAAALASGCKGNRNRFAELEQDPSFPGEPGDQAQWADLFDSGVVPSCEPAMHRDLGLRAELRLFRGKGIGDDRFGTHLGGLAQYWGWYDVTFFTRYEPIDLPLKHVLTIDEAALRSKAEEETGLDPTAPLSSEERQRVDRAVARALLHDVLELIDVYSVPPRPGINVVVVKRIIQEEKRFERDFGGVVLGLGLSPELLQSGAEDTVELAEVLREAGVPDDFTPLAIVGAATIDEWIGRPGAVIAHEAGHAYGLPHTERFGNLMHATRIACDGTLDDEQLATVERSIEEGALLTPGTRRLSATHMLPELVRRLQRRVRTPPRLPPATPQEAGPR